MTVAVPRHLHTKLGTRLKRGLGTDSLTVANGLKWGVVAELKGVIAAANDGRSESTFIKEALALAAAKHGATSDEEREDIAFAIDHRAEELRGAPVGEEPDAETGRPEPVYDPRRARLGGQFIAIASGAAVPLDLHHPTYLQSLHVKPRTRADDERALKFLLAWCEREGLAPTLQAVTRKVATRFMDGLGEIAGGQSPVTLQKYLNRLSRYWKWLLVREHVEANVWDGLHYEVPKASHEETERPFSDDEMRKLLDGPASPAMYDLIRIGALSGARLEAIVSLRAKDCADGVFVFKPQKKEKGPRTVPIHSALREIVERRRDGLKPDDGIFPEWPAPKKADSMRERSFKASPAFTAYRRSVGVDERIEGKRRSLVNFHSFRRWFATQAERADQPDNIIAAVLGHKRPGMTLGLYSRGPVVEQMRRCVEAVTLPGQ